MGKKHRALLEWTPRDISLCKYGPTETSGNTALALFTESKVTLAKGVAKVGRDPSRLFVKLTTDRRVEALAPHEILSSRAALTPWSGGGSGVSLQRSSPEQPRPK